MHTLNNSSFVWFEHCNYLAPVATPVCNKGDVTYYVVSHVIVQHLHVYIPIDSIISRVTTDKMFNQCMRLHRQCFME